MSAETELWKTVPDWPDYQVSTLGRVKRITATTRNPPGHILRIGYPKCGYGKVTLCTSAKGQDKMVHLLVLETFVGPRPGPEYEGSHKDGDQTNNRLDNLEWKTRLQNRKDKWAHGTALNALDPKQVEYVKQSDKSGTQLALELGVVPDVIWRIRNGKSYRM